MAFFEITRKSPLEAITSKLNLFKQVSIKISSVLNIPTSITFTHHMTNPNRDEGSSRVEKVIYLIPQNSPKNILTFLIVLI